MKIAIVSRGDRLIGGASRVADDTARWLIDAGHSVTHFCREFHDAPASFQRQLYGPRGIRSAVPWLHTSVRRSGFPQALPFEYYLHLRWVRDSFDLFHFHDLAGTISYETLISLSGRKPVVFTVHDCSAFTGGCIYPMGCEKYKTVCGECPQLGSWPLWTRFDRTKFMQGQRKRAAGQRNIQYVFPSEWIAQQATGVLQLEREPLQISYGIDPLRMRPTPKAEARWKLGLTQDRPVILISAHNLVDERKGARYAVEAIRQVADLSPVLIGMGYPDPDLASQLGGVPIISFGFIRDPERMALIYSAADAFLMTSLADNSPLTVYEAMASGTATIGFATGGVPELVVSNETGMLVPVLDCEALAKALRRVLLDRALAQTWGDNARQRLEKHFSRQQFVDRHCAMYEQSVEAYAS